MRSGNRPIRGVGSSVVFSMALGLTLLALSYVRVLGDTTSAAFRTDIIVAALTGPVWSTSLGNNLAVFGATQIAVHVGFGLLCLGLARLSIFSRPENKHTEKTLTLFWFAICTAWLLTMNAASFRTSSLGAPYAELATTSWHGLSFYRVFTVSILAGLIWTGLVAAKRAVKSLPINAPRWLLPAALSAGLLGFIEVRISSASPKLHDEPNVIIVGLDSLRIDAVRGKPVTSTPAIDEFLGGAVNFTNATTPLARTFPAWVSIITGRHPHTTGAVMNLLPRNRIHTGPTLPEQLSRLNYKTVYAIDEVRFSNLDRSYGFDEMIAPPIGATDFLLGFFSDTPLSNLLANTRIGAILYPYTHANRAVAHAYDPDAFVAQLNRGLNFDEPTFLVAHLTLAHWPYTWADAPVPPEGADKNATKHLYDSAVARVDRQFSDLMAMLEERGALRNAIVILLSDHGESLGELISEADSNGSHPHVDTEYAQDRLLGHGTSVLSPHQYRVLFAVRSYGTRSLDASQHREIDAAISLEDIAPTVLEALTIPAAAPFDGTSLVPLFADNHVPEYFRNRIRFTETEFNPPGIVPGQIMSTSSIFNAATYYRIDPNTDRVSVNVERLEEILENRQYAALKDGKLMAAVPVLGSPGTEYRAVLAIDGEPPRRVEDPSTHSDPDVGELWLALLNRFPSLIGMSTVAQTR